MSVPDLSIVTYQSETDNSPIPLRLGWQALSEMLTYHTPRARKEGPAWSPASYREGTTRGNVNVESLSCFVLDIDNGTRPQELWGRWQTPGGQDLTWCLHSSYKSTPDAPRWRAIFPLDSPVLAAEWPSVWDKLAFALAGGKKTNGGHADTCGDVARLYYLPACPPEMRKEAFTFARDGIPLCPSDFPEMPVAVKPQAAPKQHQNSTAKNSLSLSDQDLLAIASKASNGAKFDALWRGDVSGYDGESEADMALCSLLGFYCQGDEGRVERLFSQSGLGLREKWAGRPDYRQRTISAALAGKGEFYSPPGVALEKRARRAAASAETAEGPPSLPALLQAPAGRTDKGLPEYAPYQIAELLGIETQAPDSDAALAFRAVHAFRADLCYCKGLGWLHWGGGRWEADDREGSRTAALFVTLSRKVREEAALLFRLVSEALQQGRTEDGAALERAARAHLRHVKVVESEPFAQRAMILARSPLTVDAKLFEPRAWLIGFSNGVWDKGEWRPHRRDDYLLNLCPVCIESPAADVPPGGGGEWGALLERITGGETDYARTLQEVAGYALSGASHLRILPWAYGGKGTGKSTFAELLTAVLGEGAASIDTKLLGSDAPRERLGASLWGKRLVVCAEAGHQRIDAELLKTLSGGDSYPVRFHYQEAFTARATHVLLMTANDPPSMNAYDDALRDRVLALPCKHRLEGDDPAHPDRIIFSEGARIEEVRRNPESALVREFAAWALSGLARLFASQSLHKAARVLIATAQFWKDTDMLTPFWETVDEDSLKAGITRPDLRRLYEAWCLAEGVRKPVGPQLWTQACISAGLQETRIGNARAWKLNGSWQFAYTSYTLSPILEQNRMSLKLTHGDLPENTPGSVRSVRDGISHEDVAEDEELIL